LENINPKKVLYKSNYSLEEQIYFITSFFVKRESLKNNICFLSKKYEGFSLDKFSFYKEISSCNSNSTTPILSADISFILWIINQLENNNMQRFFKVSIYLYTD